MRNKMGFFQCMKKSVLQRVRRIIGVVNIVRWHCVVYIEERDVSSNLETTGQSRDWVLRRKVSSSDETVGARLFIAGQ